MTHTSFREGSVASLEEDWIVLMMATRGFNDQNCNPNIKKFMQLGLEHHPVNGGTHSVGNALSLGWQKLIDKIDKDTTVRSGAMAFSDPENVVGFVKDLVQADLGISVVVTGLHEGVERICRDAGIRRHTVQYSLGVWGKTERLPDPKILEITTMCGHGCIPFNLVGHMAKAVQGNTLTLEKAADELGKPCICGAFNTVRARRLLKEYINLRR